MSFEDDQSEYKSTYTVRNKSFNLHKDFRYGFITIEAKNGKTPKHLAGQFTSKELATRAIDGYVNNMELQAKEANESQAVAEAASNAQVIRAKALAKTAKKEAKKVA